MNYYQSLDTLKKISKTIPNVGYVEIGDVYNLNHRQDIEYPAVVITKQTSTVDPIEGMQYITVNIFYVDRLTSNGDNELDVQNDATEAVETILRLAEQANMLISENYTISPFTERFNDLCAGVYATVSITTTTEECVGDEWTVVNKVAGRSGNVPLKTINGIEITGIGDISTDSNVVVWNVGEGETPDLSAYKWSELVNMLNAGKVIIISRADEKYFQLKSINRRGNTIVSVSFGNVAHNEWEIFNLSEGNNDSVDYTANGNGTMLNSSNYGEYTYSSTVLNDMFAQKQDSLNHYTESGDTAEMAVNSSKVAVIGDQIDGDQVKVDSEHVVLDAHNRGETEYGSRMVIGGGQVDIYTPLMQVNGDEVMTKSDVSWDSTNRVLTINGITIQL